MLHGFLGSGRNLGLIARRWSQRDPGVRIVLPDLTGHGASPPLPENADLGTIANDVFALADALGFDRFTLVGHSLGGRVALRANMISAERLLRTVLLDSTPARVETRANEVTRVLQAVLAAPEQAEKREVFTRFFHDFGLSKGLTEWIAMNIVPGDEGYHWRIDRKALGDLLYRGRTEELWPAIEREGHRVELIWGAESTIVENEDRERMERAGCKTTRIDGAGHFLHVDKPEAVLAAILGL
jgi:pimeloyl-ACP methyl ester carboxylesterase